MKKNFGIGLLLLCATTVHAQTAPTPTPNAPVTLNPDTLRTLVLDNDDILGGLNQLYQAKDQLNVARGQLLPSLNLNMILSPSFLTSAISSLLSFLLPSNWINLRVQGHLLEAQEVSYRILQLNEYASAYSIYVTLLGDQETRDVLESQYESLQGIYEVLNQERVLNGNVSAKDVSEAQAQAQMALIQVAQADELLAKEKAAIRQMLNLDVNQDFVLEKFHVPASPIEDAIDLKAVADQAIAIAPENEQLDDLIQASKSSKWSKIFSFISSSTLGNSMSSSNSTGGGFFNPKIISNTGMSIGFSYYPNVVLADDQVDAIRVQKQQLNGQEIQMAEVAIATVQQAKKRVDLATQAEANLSQVYQTELQRYHLGLTDLLHVLNAESESSKAATTRVQSQIDLDNVRINLHRMMLTDQFAQIKGCQANPNVSVKGGFFGGLFSKKKSRLTIDQACHPSVATRY